MKVTGKKYKIILAAMLAVLFAVTAAVVPLFSERSRAVGKENVKIKLYDGEEKRLIGEVSYSDLKSFSEAFNIGEIIYHVQSRSDGGNFISKIDEEQ